MRFKLRLAVLAAVAAVTAPVAPSLAAAPVPELFFDWEVTAAPAPNSAITAAPFLNETNAAAVSQYLATSTGPKAVKVFGPLGPNALAVLNARPVEYVFADIESANESGSIQQQVATLVSQVRGSNRSKAATIGNYDNAGSGAITGASMSNLSLYPGTAGLTTAGTPNLRSSFFIAPLKKFTAAPAPAPGTHNIPYVTRFNNWGNSALNNSDGDGNPNTFSTPNQMLSRGDFSASVLHQRFRGATGLHLFEPGVVGYTKAQMEEDAINGWRQTTAANFIAANGTDNKLAFGVDTAGVIGSGSWVTKNKTTGSMMLLVSDLNADGSQYALNLQAVLGNVGSFAFAAGDSVLNLQGGKHGLFSFALNTVGNGNRAVTTWARTGFTEVFPDMNRTGVGIPEPTSMALLALGGLGLLARRRTR
jgi:hypothetical protein